MIAGVRGRLITTSFAETQLADLCNHETPAAHEIRAIEMWAARRETTFGSASSIRAITDGEHQFGSISHLTGDPRIFGRVYAASGGRGIVYGTLVP